jgi:hypothetical protein
MTCRQLRPYVVDFARGAIDAAAVESQVARHVRGCHDCRALLERERIMSAALRRVADEIDVPPADVERERALLTLFDEARARAPKRPGLPFWLWSPALAAAVLVAVVAGWTALRVAPARTQRDPEPHAPAALPGASATLNTSPAAPGAASDEARRWRGRRAVLHPRAPVPVDDVLDASFETTSFVAWPGAAAGPPLESGSVIRVSLPVSILPALGLWPPPSAGSEVPADVLVGQDGFARAVRLVPE